MSPDPGANKTISGRA